MRRLVEVVFSGFMAVAMIAALATPHCSAAPAPLPFSEDFESGGFGSFWSRSGTAGWRTVVTNVQEAHSGSYHVLMDDSIAAAGYARNELTLQVDMGGYTNAVLRFFVKGFSEEPHGPPFSPFSSADFDGVALSLTGSNWQEVLTFTNLSSNYVQVAAPLDAAFRARNWAYTTNVFVRFYQYDNGSIPSDGIALDDISITGNRPPIAESATLTLNEDAPKLIELPGSDADGDALTGIILSLPASGKLFQVANGVASTAITNVPTALTGERLVIYLPSPNRFGSNVASFQFRLSDGGAASTNASLGINIVPVNDPPSTEPDIISTLPGQTVTFDPVANDWDLDGDLVQLAWVDAPTRGTAVVHADGRLSYTPAADVLRGSEEFEYVIFDAYGWIASGTITVMVGELQGGDWTTFANGPSHTGYYPGRLGSGRFVPTWSIPYSNNAPFLDISDVVIGEGLAIFRENSETSFGETFSHMLALDVDNGRVVWKHDLPLRGFYSPTYHRGRVYFVQSNPSVLWCISAATGELLWTNDIASGAASDFAPTTAGDGVWFRTAAGWNLAGFDTNGNFRFEVLAGSHSGSSYDPYWTASYYQGALYVWNASMFRALHPETGETFWELLVRQYTPSFVSIAAAVDEGRAFLNAREWFSAMDLGTRAVAWTNAGGFIGTPAVHNGVVYITSTNTVQAFRASDGALVREYGPVPDEVFIYTSLSICPIVTDDMLITARGTNTYVFDLDTTALLQKLPHGGYAALANGTLLLAGGDAKLRSFSLQAPNDLLLTATAPAKATVWNPVRQVFTVRNSGPSAASGVQLVYRMPASANFGSAVASQGACVRSGDQVTCDLGSLTAGAQATVTLDVVPATVGWFTSQATVFRGEGDANPDNNLASVATELQLPSISVTNLVFAEGDSGHTIGMPLVSLSATSAMPVRMDFEFSPNSARAGSDFLAATGTLVFQPGEREQIVTVSIVGDQDHELDETFYFTLRNMTNAMGYSYLATCTILNDDAAPSILINNVSVSERNVGQRDAVFTLTMSKTSTLPASVFVETTNLTATAGSDYAATNSWVYFPPGERTRTFAVPIYGDVAIEPNETFSAALRLTNNVTLANTSAVCTIINDDGLPSNIDHFSFGTLPPTVVPNRPFASVLRALDANNNLAVNFFGLPSVQALLEQSSVVVGQGETNEFSPLPFAPLLDNGAGYLHCELIYLASELKGPRRLTALEFLAPPVTILPNNLTIRLVQNSRAAFDSLIWTASGATTVFETNSWYNSPALIQFHTPFDYNGIDNLTVEFDWKADWHWGSVRPGHDTRQLRALFWSSTANYHGVPVGSPSASSIVPSIRFHGATANELIPATVRFTNGLWAGDLKIPFRMDSFALQLNDGDGHVSVSQPLAMEALNELWIRIDHPEVIAANTAFVYTVTVSNSGPATSSGVAVTNNVFNAQILSVVPSRGACTFSSEGLRCAIGDVLPGATETIQVEVVPLNRSAVSIQALVSRTQPEEWYWPRVGVNVDIMQPPRISLRAETSAAEGSSLGYTYITFTATLSAPASNPVSVNWYTEDITAISEYNDPQKDYTAGFGVITFTPGETTRTFTINMWPDREPEIDETFRVRLRYGVNGVIDPERATAIGTIRNDDFPNAWLSNTSIVESDDETNHAQFVATLSRPVPFPASVTITTISGSADMGLDFVNTHQLITFPPGETNQVVSIPVRGDLIDELDEAFYVWLTSPSTNITWTNFQGTCTIIDNDPPPTITISNPAALEGNIGYTNLTFLLSLSMRSSRTITVDYRIDNATAVAGADFLSVTGRLTILAGISNVSISVPVLNDTEIEGDEQLLLVLSNATNAVLNTNIAVGMILNDDGFPGQVQSLDLSAIPSPQLANQSFPVTISARDAAGELVPGFTSPVNLRLLNSPSVGANLGFENSTLAPWFTAGTSAGMALTNYDVNGDGSFSRAVRVLPNHYVPPVGVCQFLPLHGGVTYSFRVPCGLFNRTFSDIRTSRVDLVVNSNIATMTIPLLSTGEVARFEIQGTYTPLMDGSNRLCINFIALQQNTLEAFVDDVLIQPLTPPELVPTMTGAFTNGVWVGAVTVGEVGAQMRIEADDGANHFGRSNPFDVHAYNDLSARFAQVPESIPVDHPITYSLSVSNSGPAAAPDVVVTNFLPPNVNLLAVETSRGTFTLEQGHIRFQVGTIAAGARVDFSIQIASSAAASLTNVALVSSGLTDNFPANDHPVAITRVVMPTVSINDVTVTEGHLGTTNAVFRVTLSASRTRDVWARYVAYGGAATPGTDFIGTNWLVRFPPGNTNQTIAVPVVGDLLSESYEYFTLSLMAVTNAVPGRPNAQATIYDDDNVPGLTLASVQVSDAPPGNANGMSEPGEIVHLNVVLRNTLPNLTGVSNITSTLYCTAPGVTLLNSNSAYADIRGSGLGTNLVPFVFHIPKTFPCGGTIEFIHLAEGEYRSDIIVRRQFGSRFTNMLRAPTWVLERGIDTNTSSQGTISLVLDSNQRPHITYDRYPARELKYARHDGARWITQIVPGTAPTYELQSSLALSSNDLPRIAFRATGVRFAEWDGANWQIETIANSSGSGPLLGLDANDVPYIAHTESGVLKLHFKTNGAWAVDTFGNSPVGLADAVITSNGAAHIVYMSGNQALRYAVWRGPGNWTTQNVSTTSLLNTPAVSLALDASAMPHLCYFEDFSQMLKYATLRDGVWSIEDVARRSRPYTSMQIDKDGRPMIAHYDYQLSFVLKLSTRLGPVWSSQNVDTFGGAGFALALENGLAPRIAYAGSGLHYARMVGCGMVNNAPIARDRSFTVGAGVPHELMLSGWDIDNDPLRFAIVTNSPDAQITNFEVALGTFGYMAPEMFEGIHTLTFRALDGVTNSAPGLITIEVFRDADRDGMPDAWESAHGLNPAEANDAHLDTDGDGHSNLQEYEAGTLPNDASSSLRLSLVLSGSAATLEFQAQANKAYLVEFTDSLAAPWKTLGRVAAEPSAREAVVTDARVTATRFYRVTASDP